MSLLEQGCVLSEETVVVEQGVERVESEGHGLGR